MMCIEYALDHRSPVASHLQFVRATESDELEALRGISNYIMKRNINVNGMFKIYTAMVVTTPLTE